METLSFITNIVFAVWLLALAIIDWREYRLPNIFTLTLIPVGVLATYILTPDLLIAHLLTGLVAGGIFYGLAALFRRVRGADGLGMGDVKLIIGLGIWVGPLGLLSVVLIASLLGILIALIRRAMARGGEYEPRIPFGTCLCLAAIAVHVFGLGLSTL